MLKSFLLTLFVSFFSLNHGLNYNLCVIGATSGLGKELIYRSINEKNANVLALSSSPNSIIYEPFRGDGFNEGLTKEFKNKNFIVDSYWKHITDTYDNIVFCTSAKPFQQDYSDKLIDKYLNLLPENCKNVALVSAYGVGDSINNSNLGIQVMDKLYLKDVYRAKNYQENALNSYKGNVNKLIYRPNALSYGRTLLDSISRYDFAGRIISDLNL